MDVGKAYKVASVLVKDASGRVGREGEVCEGYDTMGACSWTGW